MPDFIVQMILPAIFIGFLGLVAILFTALAKSKTPNELDVIGAKLEAFHQSTVGPHLSPEKRLANAGLWKLASVAAATAYVGVAASIMPAIAIVPAAIAYRGLKRRFAEEDDRLTAADEEIEAAEKAMHIHTGQVGQFCRVCGVKIESAGQKLG